MKRTEWFKRKFQRIDDNGLLPGIIERLEGTPARLHYKLKSHSEEGRSSIDSKWSLKDEIGHLYDLEELWLGRVNELINGNDLLRQADLTNRKTNEANHDSKSVKELIEQFSIQRKKLVSALRQCSDKEIEHEAIHPRLGTPMKIIDLAFFVAEHDDHHLAQIHLHTSK